MTANFPGGGAVPPSFASPIRPATTSRAGVWLGGIAVVLAGAALVVGVIALATGESRAASQPSPTEGTSAAGDSEVFVDDADEELCKAIAPLMRQSTDTKNAFIRNGPPGSPERNAAISKFKADTEEWSYQMQDLINRHETPPRFLLRTLQRYVDDMLLYVENIYPDQSPDEYDQPTWLLGIIDYGGPLGGCARLGVTW